MNWFLLVIVTSGMFVHVHGSLEVVKSPLVQNQMKQELIVPIALPFSSLQVIHTVDSVAQDHESEAEYHIFSDGDSSLSKHDAQSHRSRGAYHGRLFNGLGNPVSNTARQIVNDDGSVRELSQQEQHQRTNFCDSVVGCYQSAQTLCQSSLASCRRGVVSCAELPGNIVSSLRFYAPRVACPRISCSYFDNPKIKATSAIAGAAAVVSLIWCLLPYHTVPVKNYTTYEMETSCIGSSRTLYRDDRKDLHCIFQPSQGVREICGRASNHDYIKSTCATGDGMDRRKENPNCFWGLTVGPCKRGCNVFDEFCDESGHCTKHLAHIYEHTVVFTLHCPQPVANSTVTTELENSGETVQVHRNLRGHSNGVGSEYLNYSEKEWRKLEQA